MEQTAPSITAAVVAAANQEFSSALGTIEHCVRQLSTEQLWWRPRPEMNSIGNLLCHLAGNLRQWVISGLGGQPDVRNRPAEFAEQGPLPLDEVWGRLTGTVDEVQAVLLSLTPEQFLKTYRIQGFDVTGWNVVLHVATHFRGHTQEIISLSRQILGIQYQFRFVPATREQGA